MTTEAEKLKAILTGFNDGLELYGDLNLETGMTFANSNNNELYDRAVNIGKHVRNLYEEIRKLVHHLPNNEDRG